jgi:lipoate-protein ligase A
MALDEAYYISAGVEGIPTLRLYSFEPPTVTIGRFQHPESFLDRERCESAGVDVVRRPTGGLAILHKDDLTYGFTAPLEGGRQGARDRYFQVVAEGLLQGLRLLGIEARSAAHEDSERAPGWCLEGEFGVDLSWHSRKICGSAQRISADGVLQHGSVFLTDSSALMKHISVDGAADRPISPFVALDEAAGRELGFEEVAHAIRQGFEAKLGISFEPAEVGEREARQAARLLGSRYARRPWDPHPVS